MWQVKVVFVSGCKMLISAFKFLLIIQVAITGAAASRLVCRCFWKLLLLEKVSFQGFFMKTFRMSHDRVQMVTTFFFFVVVCFF